MEAKTLKEACSEMWGKHNASIRTKDGTVIEGKIFDDIGPLDDPRGQGYISLLNKYGLVEDVYADEFSELIKAW